MRKALPVVIVLLGVGLILFGAVGHTVQVLQKVAPEEKPKPPAEVSAVPSILGLPELQSISLPTEEPAPEFKTVADGEPKIVEDVTVGGLTRNEEGKVERTYSGKPPSVCPT